MANPNLTAQELATLLSERNLKLVLAESCTGGMAAALLTQIPSISNWFCGSAVTYRIPTKQSWLDVEVSTIQQFSAESQPTTDSLASGVLKKTPEADWAGAITGNLGPGVDEDLDGLVFITVVRRVRESTPNREKRTLTVKDAGPAATKMATRFRMVANKQFKLSSSDRQSRQLEAAEILLLSLVEAINSQPI